MLSTKDHTIPQDWKDGHVSPIFRKGDKGSAKNYRPVSLTAVACKLMEKFARDAIMNHLEDNNLLYKYQDGFVKGRSCVSQLLVCIDTWTRMLDEGVWGGNLDIKYLDFQKAFDTVPHQRLLQKLYAYGIQGDAHRWISNFLEGRRQRVVINGETSNWCRVTSGIPQGSVLGPALFVLYINDLPEAVKLMIQMFADDAKIFRGISNECDAKQLQSDLTTL